MMYKLIVKNFGPLKDVNIELNKINLFIGENGSGKSVLAKLVTVILNGTLYSQATIVKEFHNYNINYIQDDTIIQLYFKNKKLFSLKKQKILFYISKQDEFSNKLEEMNVPSNDRFFLIRQHDNSLTPQYIPAERNLISLFNKYVTTFITADIPLPKFLLNFSSQYVRAREEIRALDFLNVKYKFENDQERIFYNDKDYLLLERSSSGIQSALPLYLAVRYFAKKHRSIIIEEPEQNLFPKAQAETIQYIIEQVSDENNLFMMTHSPYVLSTINNLIYAHVVATLGEKEKAQVQDLVNENQWINPDDFSAYYLENGIARSIKSDMGLISDNEIDEISEEMGAEFDELLEIYRESKNG